MYGLTLLSVLSFAGAQAVPLEEYKRVETDRYFVLASTQEEAQRSAEQVEYALKQVDRYIGEKPPRLTVLIAEDLVILSLPGVAKLAPQGEAFLPFLSEEKLMAARAGAGGAASLYMLDAGAALMERDGEVKVVSIVPLPGQDPVGLEQNDVILELNGQDVMDLASFKEGYTKVAAGEQVEIVVERGTEVRVVTYARPANAPKMHVQPLARGAGMGEAMKLARAKPLSHEVGHLLLISLANKRLGADGGDGPEEHRDAQAEEGAPSTPRIHAYGHPALPDWFDEAVATLAEVPELQADRQAFLKQHLDERIALPELFTMEHPLLGLAANIRGDGKRGEGPRVSAMRVEDAGGVMLRASMFYSQANSLALFLDEKGGPGTVKRVLESLLAGKTTEESLAGIEGVPADLGELERQWLEWLAQR